MFLREKVDVQIFPKWTPVATDATIVGYDWLKDAGVVVSVVLEVGIKNDVATLVTNQILVVGRNQKVLSFAETSCSAILM